MERLFRRYDPALESPENENRFTLCATRNGVTEHYVLKDFILFTEFSYSDTRGILQIYDDIINKYRLMGYTFSINLPKGLLEELNLPAQHIF